MDADEDTAVARYLIEQNVVAREQIDAIRAEVRRRGPGSLLNVLLHQGTITPMHVLEVRRALGEGGPVPPGAPDEDPRREHKRSRLSRFLLGREDREKKLPPDLDDELPTRPTGQLKAVTGPNPFAAQTPPDAPPASEPPVAGSAAVTDAPAPKASRQVSSATEVLHRMQQNLTRLEQAIANDPTLPRANRARLTTYLYKARAVFQDIQSRLS